MTFKPYKVQAVAQLLGATTDSVRRMVDESGIKVARQDSGTKTRMFSVENIFDLARFSATKKTKKKRGERKQVVATVYAPNGGVGKTTLSGNFSSCFSLRGLKTLTIDLDFQAKLTSSLGYDSELTLEEAAEIGKPPSQLVEYHFGNLMPNWPLGRRTLDEVVKMPYGENGPHLIPADLTLDRLDTMLTTEAPARRMADMAISKLLRDGHAKKDSHFDISNYDIVLFDAPSSKNRITRGALLASDYVICPVSMEKYSTKALSYLSSVLSEMHNQFGRSPELIIVGNFLDSARGPVMTQLSMIMQTYKQSLLDYWIRHSEDFAKTLDNEADVPLVLSKPGCSASSDLQNCAAALLTRMQVTNA
ncbi:ParA family protein [Paraburkholderia acidisoli]|uniref:AAA family ATPase n=1 Tax=Paraburkholderia acidisoli TaxID=2571748 RepID=A0A7Z2GS54_9BURK|nr:AAA family ATPase [Paraburkholderia acidisoli]QGZ66961.1 AAA family ATPase [Paraburkholderia acidisoli]